MPWITTEALHRVLQSLLTAELQQVRRRQFPSQKPAFDSAPWPLTLTLGEGAAPALGCDSIELLWLSAAVNEMFCLYDAHVEDSLLSADTFGDWLEIVERGWNATGRRLTFSTSGSSGVPKRCTHEMAHLQRETDFLSRYLADTKRIVAFTPPHHIYGFLFTAILPLSMSVPVLAGEMLSPAAFSHELTPGDLIVSFPTKWEWLARSVSHWPMGVRGITSTAPCPEPLKATLLQAGLASLTEVYGSSETAGVGLRVTPQLRYTLMPFWSWADTSQEAATLQDPAGHRIRLQDHLQIASDGTFTVQSRRDGAVQVAGVNVFPGRLEDLLRSVPGVAEASVRLSSEDGRQRLKAFIVPDANSPVPALADTLDHWAKELPAPERIRSFTFGKELPRNPFGKLTDWDEPVLAASSHEADL